MSKAGKKGGRISFVTTSGDDRGRATEKAVGICKSLSAQPSQSTGGEKTARLNTLAQARGKKPGTPKGVPVERRARGEGRR